MGLMTAAMGCETPPSESRDCPCQKRTFSIGSARIESEILMIRHHLRVVTDLGNMKSPVGVMSVHDWKAILEDLGVLLSVAYPHPGCTSEVRISHNIMDWPYPLHTGPNPLYSVPVK